MTDGYTAADQDWRTPPHIFAWLDRQFHFTLDAAADDANHLCPDYLTEARSGLTHSWAGQRVYANPPYGRGLQAPWFYKALDEARQHDVLSVLLVPALPDRAWFQDTVSYAAELWLLRGRIRFLQPDGRLAADPPKFPSAVVVFRPNPTGNPCILRFVTPPSARCEPRPSLQPELAL